MKNNLTIVIVLVLLVLIAGAVLWEKKGATPSQPIAILSYTCDDGKSIEATLYEGESKPAAGPDMPPTPGGSAQIVLSDGREMTLAQTLSADGVRYATTDESLVFWTKGNGAFVTEGDTQTYANCTQVAK
jgi:membrane-bound inhibitor of C-type lysozyme